LRCIHPGRREKQDLDLGQEGETRMTRPALQAPVSWVVDNVARPVVVFPHNHEGIFIEEGGFYLSG